MRLKTIKRFHLIEAAEKGAWPKEAGTPEDQASKRFGGQLRSWDKDSYAELEGDIMSFAKSSPRYGLMVIAGRAGTGKSTGIKNVMRQLGHGFQDLPRLTNENAINKDDAKENDRQMKEYQALPPEDRPKYIEKLIADGNFPEIKDEYQAIKTKLLTVKDPQEEEELKNQQRAILNKFKPKSNASRLLAMGANPPAYKSVFYLGSQNLNKEQLYFELYRGNGGIIVYDDSNISFWDDKLLQDLLLHAAQTEKEKWVSMPGAAEGYLRTQKGNLFPTKFKFTGKIIIVTNRRIKELPANIQTRAFKHDFNPASAEVLKKTGENLEGLRKDFDEYPPEYVEEVYNWLMQNKGGVKYDFRLFAHLMFLRDRYPDMEEFSRRAKKMIKDFYSAEKDEVKSMRERRIRQAMKNYETARRTSLSSSQRRNIVKYLRAVSDKELASPDLNDTLDLVVGYERPGTEQIGVKPYNQN